MFISQATLSLKENSASEFTRLIEKQIIPLLRMQKGFCDEVTFVAPERSEAIASSLCNTKENAEAYSRTVYPQVLKALLEVVEGTPLVKTFELSNSTFHMVAARAARSTHKSSG